jgi:prefoldin subunit 5
LTLPRQTNRILAGLQTELGRQSEDVLLIQASLDKKVEDELGKLRDEAALENRATTASFEVTSDRLKQLAHSLQLVEPQLEALAADIHEVRRQGTHPFGSEHCAGGTACAWCAFAFVSGLRTDRVDRALLLLPLLLLHFLPLLPPRLLLQRALSSDVKVQLMLLRGSVTELESAVPELGNESFSLAKEIERVEKQVQDMQADVADVSTTLMLMEATASAAL